MGEVDPVPRQHGTPVTVCNCQKVSQVDTLDYDDSLEPLSLLIIPLPVV